MTKRRRRENKNVTMDRALTEAQHIHLQHKNVFQRLANIRGTEEVSGSERVKKKISKISDEFRLHEYTRLRMLHEISTSSEEPNDN